MRGEAGRNEAVIPNEDIISSLIIPRVTYKKAKNDNNVHVTACISANINKLKQFYITGTEALTGQTEYCSINGT